MSGFVDSDLVETLYRRYWVQVERRCLRMLHNPEEATDAAQEVFVQLIRRGAGFRGYSEWMTWLYRVATNVSLNRLRSRRRRETPIKSPERRFAQQMDAPEDAMAARDAIVSIMPHFDDATLRAVLLYYVDELSQSEIAEILCVSRIAVNRRLARFRARARTLLTRQNDRPGMLCPAP